MPNRRFGYAAGGSWVAFAVATLGLALIATATPVQAVTFDLTSCHVPGGCGTQTSFGTVTLTQNGASVDFVVSLAGGNRFVETVLADQQLFKFNGPGVAGNIINEATANPLNAVPNGLNGFAGSFNGDSTGNFGFGIACVQQPDCNGGSTPIFTGLTFTVTNATIAQLTVPNNFGNLFVADVLIASNGNTGPVDVTGPRVVPEPVTLFLLMVGTAFARLGGAWRRRQSQKAGLGGVAVSGG
jgi:hypothetical protein